MESTAELFLSVTLVLGVFFNIILTKLMNSKPSFGNIVLFIATFASTIACYYMFFVVLFNCLRGILN